MKYLRVKNWEHLQHQSPKPLPWIKFFTALLAPTKEPAISEWPDSTKCLLYHLWLMAMVFHGRIPETWITKEKLNLKSRINLDPILESGFIWFENENGLRIVSSRGRDARSGLSGSKEVTPKRETTYEEEFASLWQDYPHRIGRKAALKHFIASRKAGHEPDEVRRALSNYKAHIASENVAMKFIQHGSTWFNNWLDWRDGEPVTATPGSRPGFTV